MKIMKFLPNIIEMFTFYHFYIFLREKLLMNHNKITKEPKLNNK